MIRYACVDGEIRAITYVICPFHGSGDSHGRAGGRRSSWTVWSGAVERRIVRQSSQSRSWCSGELGG